MSATCHDCVTRKLTSCIYRTRQLEEVAILSTLAAAPHSNILQFQEAWEEKRQLHIRTALADCGDFATYLQSISDDGGLDEGRSWKVLHELLGVSPLAIAMRPVPDICSTTGLASHPLSRHPPPRPETSQYLDRPKWNVTD